MRVQVLYFAIPRERSRMEAEVLDLPPGATAEVAMEAVAAAHPELAPLLPRLQVAVNRSFVGKEHTLCDGDEVALIPPVAGGSGRKIAVTAEPIALAEVIACVAGPEQGGLVTFTGNVRRQGQQPNVIR